MRTSQQKNVKTARQHSVHPAGVTNTHGGAAAKPHNLNFRRRLLALRAGVLAAVRALRSKTPKKQ